MNISNSARWVGFISSSFIAQTTQEWTISLIQGSDGHVSIIILRTACLSLTFPENTKVHKAMTNLFLEEAMDKNKADGDHTELVWGRSCSSFPSEHQTQQQLGPGKGSLHRGQQTPLSPTARGGEFQTRHTCGEQHPTHSNSQLQRAQTWIFMSCPG